MSRVEKQREGRCLGWKNDGREYVLGGKTTEGNMSKVSKITRGNMSGREFFLSHVKQQPLVYGYHNKQKWCLWFLQQLNWRKGEKYENEHDKNISYGTLYLHPSTPLSIHVITWSSFFRMISFKGTLLLRLNQSHQMNHTNCKIKRWHIKVTQDMFWCPPKRKSIKGKIFYPPFL